MQAAKILIGGSWRETSDKVTVKNPYSGEVVAEVCKATSAELSQAIDSAQKAAEQMKSLARFEVAAGLRARNQEAKVRFY